MADYYHVRLALSEYEGQFRSELFTEDLGDTDGDLLPARWEVLEEWIPSLLRGAGDLDSSGARSVGKQLFEYLLGRGENSKKWMEILQQADRLQRAVRVLIDATSESVRDLPYGLLYEPHDNYFLLRATSPAIQLVRIVRRATPRALRPMKPIRLLVAAAEPIGREFDCAKSLCTLAQSLRGLVELSFCTAQGVQRLEDVAGEPAEWRAEHFSGFCKSTKEAVQASVQGKYDILHLLAHGFGDSVWLCDTSGKEAQVQAQDLANSCRKTSLQMAFLQVCKGAESRERGGFGGLAQQLLNPKLGDLAAVVASVYPLQIERSTRAAISFYERLSKGQSPDAALDRDGLETDWTWAFLELWVRPQALGNPGRGAFQFVSPYRGLARFEERDADIFFGRDAATAEVLKILWDEPLLVVVGDSGSGKSSLLQAGIAHRVRTNGLGGERRWQIISTRPGSNPVQSLRKALGGTDLSSDSDLIDVFKERIRDESPLLLIIDQSEELFTLSSREQDRRLIAETLARVIEQNAKNFRLVIAIRSDYLGSVAVLPGLRDLIKRPWILKSPTTEELRSIIEQPARNSGYTFEGAKKEGDPDHGQDLLHRILADPLVIDTPRPASTRTEVSAAPLPLIEFALDRLWLRAVGRNSHEFTHVDFDELRGLGGAVGDYAEQVCQDLLRHQALGVNAKELAQRLVIGLVTADNTRRPRRKDELEQETEAPETAKPIIDYLVGERLLTIRTDPDQPGIALVELAHEVLITSWQRLRDWLETTQDERRIREDVEEAAARWHDNNRDKNYLDHRGPRLQAAETLLSEKPHPLSAEAKEYILACHERDNQESAVKRSRVKRNYIILSATALLLACLSVLLWLQKTALLSSKLAAQSHALRERRFDLSLLLALEGFGVSDTVETRGALLAGMLQYPNLVAYLRKQDSVSGPADSFSEIVTSLAFAHAGRVIASGSADGSVTLWDLDTRSSLPVPAHDSSSITSIALSDKGDLLATGSDGISILDRRTESWAEPLKTGIDADNVHVRESALAISADGKKLGSTFCFEHTKTDNPECLSSEVDVWQIGEGVPDESIQLRGSEVSALRFQTDDKLLVANSDGIFAWNFKKHGRPNKIGTLDGTKALHLNLSSQGQPIACGTRAGQIVCWEVTTQRIQSSFASAHEQPVTAIAMDPASETLLTGAPDGNVLLWSLKTSGRIQQVVDANLKRTGGVDVSPDGSTAAAAGLGLTILVNLRTGQYTPLDSVDGDLGLNLEFSPDGRRLAIPRANGVALYDLSESPKFDRLLPTDGSYQFRVAFSADGRYLASAGENGRLYRWDCARNFAPLSSLSLPLEHGRPPQVLTVAFSADSHVLAAAGGRAVILWDASSGHVLGSTERPTMWLAFAPRGNLLAFGDSEGKEGHVGLAEQNLRLMHYSLTGADHIGGSLQFSSDGSYLFWPGSDGNTRIWDVHANRLLGSLPSGLDSIEQGLALSKDSTLLVDDGPNGTVNIWNLDIRAWKAFACSIAARDLTPLEWDLFVGRRTTQSIPSIKQLQEMTRRLFVHSASEPIESICPSARAQS
jgi:WD40 repeat protein